MKATYLTTSCEQNEFGFYGFFNDGHQNARS
jgi:hypothetical protein